MSCRVILIVANNGGVNWRDNSTMIKPFDGPLAAGGDSQSERCLLLFNFYYGGLNCVDVTLASTYSLEIQPEITRTKLFRFVGRRESFFEWEQQRLEAPRRYCEH